MQIVTSVVLVTVELAVKFNVAMESQPDVLTRVTLYVPAAG